MRPPCEQPGEAGPSGWRARLELGFARRGERTVMVRRRHHGPLMVQSPFYPQGDHACHVYLLHPPGGMVPGDETEVEVCAEAGARVLLTTPAANKLYRSDGRVSRAVNRLRVAAGAALEWLPQETIAFPGVDAALHTCIELAAGARFIGWEHWCLGLPARAEPFDRGRLESRMSVCRADEPLLLERQVIAGEGPVMQAAWGLAGYPVAGTLIAYPAPRAAMDGLRAACEAFGGGLAGATQLGELTVVRALARTTGGLQRLWHALWEQLRPPVMGQAALAPRIWAT